MKNKNSNKGKIKVQDSKLVHSEIESFFWVRGRICRNEFAWNFFTFIIICILALINSGASDFELINIVISLIIIVISRLIVQRLHDLGRPAFHFSLFLIPIYDLCRKDGQVGVNKYGDDPLKIKGQKQ